MHATVLHSIDDVDAREWNRISGTRHPFLRHEFLAALERNDCVGERWGWLPHHLTVRDDGGRLCGLAPFYLKDNSYGEFVFDWSWADAWHRAGLHYYPKLVSAIPYTPVTGRRLLVADDADQNAVREALLHGARQLARDCGASTIHWLFTDMQDTRTLLRHGYLRRSGCHFHWYNLGYTSFEDYLGRLNSRKRKKIRRERRRVAEAGISMEMLRGNQADDRHWQAMHAFYCSTFMKKSGMPTLTLDFFREIAATMGEQILLVFALHNDTPVAGAVLLRSDDALYGRYWGCARDYSGLHFETCYYQGIDYCIRHGLQLFEPGVQGEHKISRGFLPTLTWSAHWIADRQFREVIARYLVHEHELVADYHDELHGHSPYRQPDDSP